MGCDTACATACALLAVARLDVEAGAGGAAVKVSLPAGWLTLVLTVPPLCRRRYADGDDKEALEKATVKLTDEEQSERDAAIAAGKSVVDFLNSRWVGGWAKEGALQ